MRGQGAQRFYRNTVLRRVAIYAKGWVKGVGSIRITEQMALNLAGIRYYFLISYISLSIWCRVAHARTMLDAFFCFSRTIRFLKNNNFLGCLGHVTRIIPLSDPLPDVADMHLSFIKFFLGLCQPIKKSLQTEKCHLGNEIRNVHGHFVDLGRIVQLDISQNPDILACNEVNCHTLTAESSTATDTVDVVLAVAG